ncbi:hypothetical protein C0J52_01720 [Blattella germanica]|nr:hypothetical protein C0J52_01720 [Blattella germanica]
MNIKFKMKALLILVFVSFVAISCVVSQTSVKPGACSPALPIQVCENECTSDSQCTGTHKCCRTKCGGNVCSEPVTLRTRVNRDYQIK